MYWFRFIVYLFDFHIDFATFFLRIDSKLGDRNKYAICFEDWIQNEDCNISKDFFPDKK